MTNVRVTTGDAERSGMSVTTKGRRWEILHSLWIGWTFTLSLFNWVAFLYIGFRTRQWTWMLWALFYSAPLVTIISVGPPVNLPTWLVTVIGLLFLGLGVISIFHAFRVRKEYLMHLEALKREKSRKEEALRWQIIPDTNQEEPAKDQTTDTVETSGK